MRPQQPAGEVEIVTTGLLLRPLAAADAPAVAEQCADPLISETTLTVPRPYSLEDASRFIEFSRAARERGEMLGLGIFDDGDGRGAPWRLVGTCGLVFTPRDRRAELGFWIGVPFWGRGYATEAAGAIVDFGFRVLALERIHAGHFAGNEASGRVQHKLGMVREGVLRKHHVRFGERRDLVVWAVLREEWLARHPEPFAAWRPLS